VRDRLTVAEAKNLTLTLADVAHAHPVEADRKLLGQVVSILLTNALNYTPAGGKVAVCTQTRQIHSQLWAGFAISDDGPGIPDSELDQLFSRFFRGQAGRESGISGTGLGLAIAHEIVQLHHGQIEVESSEMEHGATFSVWLPVLSDSPPVSD